MRCKDNCLLLGRSWVPTPISMLSFSYRCYPYPTFPLLSQGRLVPGQGGIILGTWREYLLRLMIANHSSLIIYDLRRLGLFHQWYQGAGTSDEHGDGRPSSYS